MEWTGRSCRSVIRGGVANSMVWYVALVAILNLGLGYAVAVYLGAGRTEKQVRQVVEDAEPDESFDDEYESTEPSELESAAIV